MCIYRFVCMYVCIYIYIYVYMITEYNIIIKPCLTSLLNDPPCNILPAARLADLRPNTGADS